MSDPFEDGGQAFLSVHSTDNLPPICPFDPAIDSELYGEWFAGYEYVSYLSTLPETKLEREFGPFKKLLKE